MGVVGLQLLSQCFVEFFESEKGLVSNFTEQCVGELANSAFGIGLVAGFFDPCRHDESVVVLSHLLVVLLDFWFHPEGPRDSCLEIVVNVKLRMSRIDEIRMYS